MRRTALLFAPQRGSSRKTAAYIATHKALASTKRKRGNPEFRFQVEAVKFLRLVLPADCIVAHIPNGSASATERKMLAALGCEPGMPDLMVFSMLRIVGFECKSKKGSLSPAQKAMHLRLDHIGIHVATVRTLDAIEVALRQWGFSLRGTIR